MVILVISNNFFVLFFGWEGVGLCSYLLISFWSTRIQSIKSANKALFVNKLGDSCLLIAISAIFYTFNSLDFYTVFSLAFQYQFKNLTILWFEIPVLTFISFFLVLAAMAKSAQIFLHTWLPDAMEGPTPVSALIHAATMVTAGVFLIIKCSFIIEFSKSILIFMVYVGIITSVLSGLIGFFQYDIKKIIAYSTCSQLGYMFFSCGLSAYHLSLFHLFNHAFFKSLLFLSAGSIIHCVSNEQDIRKMGGLFKLLPLSYVSILIASLSLSGLPFLSGFFSKESILELSYLKLCNEEYYYLFFFSLFSIGLTTAYSAKLLFFCFFSKNVSFKAYFTKIREPLTFFTVFTLVFLSLCSLFSGFFFQFFFSRNNFFFQETIFFLDNHASVFSISDINYYSYLSIKDYFARLWALCNYLIVLYSFVIVINFLYLYSLFFFCYEKKINFGLFDHVFYKKNNSDFYLYLQIHTFFSKNLFIDNIYNYLSLHIYKFGYSIFLNLDKGLFELLGPTGLFNFFFYVSHSFNKASQSGIIYKYTFSILINIVLIFTLFFFKWYT